MRAAPDGLTGGGSRVLWSPDHPEVPGRLDAGTAPVLVESPAVVGEKPPGEWNTARIRCDDKKLTVWINGTLMNEGIDLSATHGAICLQSEGGEVHFRKIELTPLK